MTIRVVLVDDQEMIRMGFRMVLSTKPGIEVVGEADDGDTAVALLAGLDADVVLMDIRMPRLNGVEATRQIRALPDAPQVLILTTFDLDEYAYEALKAGASGFLLKDTPVDDIAAAIEHIYRGDAVVAPSTTRRLLDHFAAAQPIVARADRGMVEELTPRENEILILMGRAMSNA
ncbi:MAG: response regulator transcription factor, partial [Actinomycetaceae bacterium]|nr:response regulator transcription factor [Actinomycetaceae bacterium]